MVDITETVTTINKMVRGRMEAVPINEIVGQPTINSVRHLVKQLADFSIHFATTIWGGKQGFLPLVLTETKMSLSDIKQNLDCKRIEKSELLNPKI